MARLALQHALAGAERRALGVVQQLALALLNGGRLHVHVGRRRAPGELVGRQGRKGVRDLTRYRNALCTAV